MGGVCLKKEKTGDYVDGQHYLFLLGVTVVVDPSFWVNDHHRKNSFIEKTFRVDSQISPDIDFRGQHFNVTQL